MCLTRIGWSPEPCARQALYPRLPSPPFIDFHIFYAVSLIVIIMKCIPLYPYMLIYTSKIYIHLLFLPTGVAFYFIIYSNSDMVRILSTGSRFS